MDIIRHHKWNFTVLGKGDQLGIDSLLLGDPVVLQLQIEIFAKNRLISQRSLSRLLITTMQQKLRHFSAQTSTKADNPL
ncbi:hypothetical protein D3C81_2123500 [compost metagenome]